MRQLLDASARFWLDLAGLDETTADQLLLDTFGFHPLAVEDAEHFGQRPKLDRYDNFALMVVYGATASGQLVEVHCFYTDNYLVTVHRDACPGLAALASRLKQRAEPRPDHVMLLYRVVDTLIDGYFPVLADLDDRIDELEDAILQRPTDQQLGQLFDMKRSLIALRKVVTPQRDMFATLLSGTDALPGMTADAERYFRDLYDHLIRISDLVDSYRDLLSGVLDTHLSTVSNPAERGHEAAHHHGYHLPAAELPDRVLRAELRLDGEPAHQPAGLPRRRHRPASRRRGRPDRRVPPPRLAHRRRHRATSPTRRPATCDSAGAVAPGAPAQGTAVTLTSLQQKTSAATDRAARHPQQAAVGRAELSARTGGQAQSSLASGIRSA